MACRDCDREDARTRFGGRQCARCYMRAYRKDPEKAAKHRAAVIAYTKRNPDKRRRWVRTWKERIGWYVPDLQDLRRAIKRLDRAVVYAERREGLRITGEPGGNDGPERGD